MIVLKLGGSVITCKDRSMAANNDNIRRIAEEIASSRTRRLIIVHGGGSFGHPLAKQYRIGEGYHSEAQLIGVSKIHGSMVTLNRMVVESLTAVGVPAMGIAPSSFMIAESGRIGSADFDIIESLADRGITPVLYGDIVLDRAKGFSIISGDQLAARLAIDLKAHKLLFGVDVDGVYTSNPKIVPEARLIERLPVSKLRGILEVGGALTTDVTGGMFGKVSEASMAAEAGVEVLIFNATKPENTYKALKGESVRGTIIVR
ncbi:MAG: isopentenyl phosphate kinase [Candidatus Bathyarchaeia archaeon]|nr:isopentenyl phosphate kinase family protein [Candidatus Bathyarchaeota archaeon]